MNISLGFGGWVGLIIVLLLLFSSAVHVLKEYERAVVFRMGRLIGDKGPGMIFIIPFVDKIVKVSLRIITLDVASQEVITKDNVPVKINAVVYFRVIDPNRSIVEISDYVEATSAISQTTLRSVVGQIDLDDLLSKRDKVNNQLQQIIDKHTDPWGIKVSTVELKDLEIPENMKRAMAKQAEAERERRAKIINAEGEYQAANRLKDAASIISTHPEALQLRFLQTVREVSTDHNSTLILPLPIELLKAFIKDPKRTPAEEE
ncbi:MAG: slipin family protein [Epsilonproteobacteria bacterium]|nr:slipin family protein [Campylobacterota bacterium]